MSFLGIQPRIAQVPPTKLSSAIATRAPKLAARLEAASPPDPAPMTKRS